MGRLKSYYKLKRFGLVHVGYVKAVDGVSFTLNKGEALLITGESGCGKTTLAKTILGLIRPFAGKVVNNGKDITQLDRKARLWYSSQVGFVQQDPYEALLQTFKKVPPEEPSNDDENF